ncbi:MAG: hypothetical protein KAQ92_01970, partial [Candidatus Aenigmarchaeota archaeon]|nr:hypothetical protein [Candidatus Aenigmarchaeota archaeon]
MKMKKAFFFTMDAVVAFMFLLIATVLIFQAAPERDYDQISYKTMHFNAEDALQILSVSKLSDLNGAFVSQLLNETHLEEEDLDKNLLDICGLLWSYNQTKYIENITWQTFGPLIPEEMKYSIKIKDIDTNNIVYNSSTGYYNAKTLTSASRMMSGYKENVPSKGYAARATILQISKDTSEYLYFGGFIGQGNITKTFTMPSNINKIKKIYMEMNTGENFTLYINGKYSGDYYRNASQTQLRANLRYNITNQTYLNYILPDENNISIMFLSNNLTRKYIGGGFIKILYNTTQINTLLLKDKYYFSGVDGIFNIYSSFYVPGQLNNMNVFLHYKSSTNDTNATVYLKIANATIFESKDSGEQSISLNDSQILTNLSSAGLDYDFLSSKTIPLRLGYVEGGFSSSFTNKADIVFQIDSTGSMT